MVSRIRRRAADIKSATDLIQVCIYLPPDVHRSLKQEALDRHMSMGAIIEEAFTYRLAFARPKPPTKESS